MTAARLALDTSAYSKLREGDARVIDAISRAEVVLLPVTVLGELEAGFRAGNRYRENRKVLDEFLEEPFVEVFPITAETARRYGEIFADLRRRGTPIPTNDLWIAAAASDRAAHLLTFDRHFERVASLEVTVLRAEK